MNTLLDFLFFIAWVLVPSLAIAGGLRFLAWLAGAKESNVSSSAE